MEIKTGAEGNFNTDHSTQGEKILIGISGSLDSMVAAYLLKIQRYNLLAVTVVNVWDESYGPPPNNLACFLSEERI